MLVDHLVTGSKESRIAANIAKSEVGFNKKVARALGTGKRVMHTEERPAFLAKNRYELPETLPLDWSEFVKAMPQPQ